jgi:hypothetical protein
MAFLGLSDGFLGYVLGFNFRFYILWWQVHRSFLTLVRKLYFDVVGDIELK